MDQIKELGNIIYKERPDLFAMLAHTDSKKSMLFRAIMEGMVNTDQSASMLIYGKLDKGKKYQMLKRNLKDKLIELLNDLHSRHQPRLEKEIDECREKIILAENLLANNVFHFAEKMLLQVNRRAELHQLFSILAETSKLFSQINSLKGYPDEVERWNKQYEQFQILNQEQQRAIGFLNYLNAYFVHHCGLQSEIALKIDEYANSIAHWAHDKTAPNLRLVLLQIKIKGALHQNQFSEIEALIKQEEGLLKKNPFFDNKTLRLNMLLANSGISITKGDLSQADLFLQQAYEQSDYKSFRRFEVQALLFSLKIKQLAHLEAGEIIREVSSTYEFTLFHPEAKAAWHLRKAYLFLILSANQNNEAIQTFLPEFLAENLVLALDENCKKLFKDKQGFHLHYLIVRLLLSWKSSLTEVYYIGKNMQLYYYRNLKNMQELRLKNLFRSLASLAINGFRFSDIAEQETLFKKSLSEQHYINRFDLNEIVPAEMLYKILLQIK
ncbi:MAG: hypothetical protein IPM71_09515 [Bacteroidota bacterium]|nr:MAG: hypothetical protein IPM71_09515 [Bacteroidota bacterium]